MAMKLKEIKVRALCYFIYEGDKEQGTEFFCAPEVAVKLARRGKVELVKHKKEKEVKNVRDIG